MTPLDTAQSAMDAAPEDTTKRMAFYERVADSELFSCLKPKHERQNPTRTVSGRG